MDSMDSERGKAELEKGTFTREFDIPTISETLQLYQKIEGDVSCVVWDASIVLSKFLEKQCLKRRDFLKDKKVVELGAGLACVGLTAACLGAQVISTDLSEAIPLLNLNVDKNEHVWSKYGQLKTVALKWGDNHDLASTPDIILLADCVYYEESIQPLICTLVNLAGPQTQIYLCQEMRESEYQEKYWKIFMSNLEKHFKVQHVPLSEQNEEFCSTDIILLQLQKRSCSQ